ncbi:uncharacterized protein BDV14DRAFT_88175 [Aspergillus stella-maris]|uniref:uncharacterized protein n=1 Tax=Aspergillus stella-maris TaxID=1810926 RepID=UPI003CCD74FB
MSNNSSTPPISVPPSSSRQRRASIASGLSFPEYKSGNSGLAGPTSGSMANAMANAQSNQRRRLSITTLGLSGSPTQTLQYGSRNYRQGSISSSVGSSPGNSEEAVAEDENSPPSGLPKSPFARRLSFGAQALRDARTGSIGNGEGFNWSEALRTRAERGPISPNSAQTPQVRHQRAASIASMDQPAQEMPKQPKQQNNKPDFFQEKILRGDFMD